MTHTNIVCVQQVYFSDVENTGETDSVENPKSIHGNPFGKAVVPKE